MKDKLQEQAILLLSVSKWTFLASLVGVLVGAATALFLKMLNWASVSMSAQPYYFLALPAAFVVSSLLVTKLAPDAEGHGTEKVIEAIHKRNGKIDPPVVPVKLASTIVTIAAGGSAGKEGPCAQIGAGISSLLADLLKFNDNDRRKVAICGISAGFASVFGTPIAGALFGVEILVVGDMFYSALLPSFISGIIGYHTALYLGAAYPTYPSIVPQTFGTIPLLEVIGGGIFFGLCSLLLIEGLKLGEWAAKKLSIPKHWKAVMGGAALAVFGLAFSTSYLGLGLDTLGPALQGARVPWDAFILKIAATTMTLSFGGSGGIVTPIFFIGSTAGSAYAQLLGLDLATFAAIGFVSVLAGSTNAPVSACIMAMELFGPGMAPFAAISCLISFLMAGHRSVYPSQMMKMAKSSSLEIEGETIEDLKVKMPSGVSGLVERLKHILHNG